MSCIRIISDHLANQIAAGEVVERPVSVVKELLENSLDAGSARIEIQVEGSGTRLIRVLDNGMGMDEDDVLLCLERHATSKLQEESQLGAITTLGFRGEAIPSIASVSRLTILSRTEDSPTGTRAEIRYGTLHAVHEDGCGRGTMVEVKNLFGNIPARKKFLKTARTELFHIEEIIKNQALAHPQISFSLQVDGRQRLEYPAVGNLKERVRAVFRYKGNLLLLEQGDDDGMHIEGFLLMPESVSASSARLRLVVNGRAVQDRMIRHGVIEGLQGFLMKGYSPAGVVALGLSPEAIDVNVHPAKREIRFHRPRDVHRFVTETTRKAVQDYQEQVRSELFSVPSDNRIPTQPERDIHYHGAPPAATRPVSQVPSVEQEVLTAVMEIREPESCPLSVDGKPDLSMGAAVQGRSLCGLSLIGQLLKLYLLCEKDGRLLVIDQHAAHERILYGRLRQAYCKREVPGQNLLFPVTVELGPDHCDLMEHYGEEVASLGLQVDHFGDTTYVIKAVPALVSQLPPEDILIDSLDALKNWGTSGQGAVPAAIDKLFASMACKAAIKAGNRLQPKEMIALLEQMEKSDVFSHCPHGRPVIKEFSRAEIEKWFHRG